MRLKFIAFLIGSFAYSFSFAQNSWLPVTPLPFDNFVEKPSVQWAMYAIDTIRFEKINLNALLRKRYRNNEIKGTSGLQRFAGLMGSYLSNDKLDTMTFSPGGPNYQFDKYADNLLEIAEIFYVKKEGSINSYIPWVSPKMSVITPAGTYLGTTLYFSTAYNFKYEYRGKKNDKHIGLGSTSKTIRLDSSYKYDMLKQLYGNNMLEAIWKDLLTNHKVYYAVNNKELKPDELTLTLEDNVKISVPVYDSVGNITGSATQPSRPLNPSDFSAMEIMQDWQYNETRNIVTSEIKEIILIGNYKPDAETATQTRPVLRIVY